MNKLQYIKLLELRGITELNGMSIGEAVRTSGGKPTDSEMAKVNSIVMEYYIEKFMTEEKKNVELVNKLSILQKKVCDLESRSEWLSCLEQAGVDNWEGYNHAVDILEGND